jgi:hypothetical protein
LKFSWLVCPPPEQVASHGTHLERLIGAMTPMTPQPCTAEVSETVGKLCVGGDWACAHGDFAGLRQIVRQLADYAPEPIHCELVELASACSADPDRAALLWQRLKDLLYREAYR